MSWSFCALCRSKTLHDEEGWCLPCIRKEREIMLSARDCRFGCAVTCVEHTRCDQEPRRLCTADEVA